MGEMAEWFRLEDLKMFLGAVVIVTVVNKRKLRPGDIT